VTTSVATTVATATATTVSQPEETSTTTSSPQTTTVPPTTVEVQEQQKESVTAIQESVQELVSKPAEDITTEDIRQIVELVENLSGEQLAEVVSALSEAPDDAKKVFEEAVDVYSGQFDEYVPSGSVISIAERRIVSAVTATLFVLPAPMPSTTASSSSRRNK